MAISAKESDYPMKMSKDLCKELKRLEQERTRRGQRGKVHCDRISAAQLDTIIKHTGIDQVEKDLIEIKLGKKTQKVWDFPMMDVQALAERVIAIKKTNSIVQF